MAAGTADSCGTPCSGKHKPCCNFFCHCARLFSNRGALTSAFTAFSYCSDNNTIISWPFKTLVFLAIGQNLKICRTFTCIVTLHFFDLYFNVNCSLACTLFLFLLLCCSDHKKNCGAIRNAFFLVVHKICVFAECHLCCNQAFIFL